MKYKIDVRLQDKWQLFGIHPDEIEWVAPEDLSSAGERTKVWEAIVSLVDKYIVLYNIDIVNKSRIFRAKRNKGNGISEEQLRIATNPSKVVKEEENNWKDKFKTLLSL